MNQVLEYFHSVVEDYFKRDQYEVSYDNGFFTVKILLSPTTPIHNFTGVKLKNRMEELLQENFRRDSFKVTWVTTKYHISDSIRKNYITLRKVS